MDEELKKELDLLTKSLEGKTTEQVKSAIEDFQTKHAEAAKKAKDDTKALLDSAIIELEAKFIDKIKVVQDHADKLDVKLKKGDVKELSKKSFGENLKEALEEKTDEIEKFQRKETKSLVLELKAVGDMTTGNVTGGSRYGQVMAPDIIDRPSRKVHMDEILPGGSIGPGNTFTFMREVGNGEGDPAAVSEGGTKPQFDFDLEEDTVNIETVAGWLRVTRKAMSNIPGFISFLQRRIPERFRRVLDNQILYGDGNTPNLKGILTAGNFIDETTPEDKPVIEKIIEYISLLEDTHERDADTILVRPAEYYNLFLNKASGSGEYDLPDGLTFVNGMPFLFGIPIRMTTALASTDIVVGDFSMGAQLLTQEAMRIEFFEQDGDNVRTNKVTVRVEGNYALPVYGPDYFVKGTTATA